MSSPQAQRFNPRLPGGRRHIRDLFLGVPMRVSIHAFRGEGDQELDSTFGFWPVSIHAFRGEGDRRASTPMLRVRPVSIHAFRGEGDQRRFCVLRVLLLFQSTPSGGKATASARRRQTYRRSFNPRLPGGRRLQYLGLLCPVPARYCSMIRIFRVALGTICPYIRFLRCC